MKRIFFCSVLVFGIVSTTVAQNDYTFEDSDVFLLAYHDEGSAKHLSSGVIYDVKAVGHEEEVHQLTFIVTDKYNKALEGVEILIEGEMYSTDNSGRISGVNLPDGTYPISISGDIGKTATSSVTVDGSDIVERIQLLSEENERRMVAGINLFPDSAAKEDGITTGIRTYPNPVINQLTIAGAEGQTVNIYNSKGSLVSQEVSMSNLETIDFGRFPKGLYILKAGKYTTRIILN